MDEHDENCIECGGQGLEGEPCPDCGKQKGTMALTSMTGNQLQSFVSRATYLGVPEHYIGIEWTPETFWRTKPADASKDLNLVKYIKNLEKVHDVFANKMVYGESLIILAPSTFSKVTFAYSCMQLAMAAGHDVAPLLDTTEAKRLMVLASENPNYKLYHRKGSAGLDYDSWLMSTVMFITVTKTEYNKEASLIMRELLDRRSRKGLSTFFLTEFGMDVLTAKDTSNAFARHSSLERGTFDKRKYPSMIHYTEFLN